eukprot:CAMPEP_0196139394 /NCGR_PEP_ID=MMETSP0910-20130528/6686_1 /TAXON_ID=49265 /ORGANISM="Thalassiosira rotula, Strain GSO102" /LENGTH=331 /DNA_ID=CAMNT_0041400111 /DNA_START=135 /DNA_END=1127 /DNA_ORIENTATION=-
MAYSTAIQKHVALGASELDYFTLVNKRLHRHSSESDFELYKLPGESARWYLLFDIEESDRIADQYQGIIRSPAHEMLSKHHSHSRDKCNENLMGGNKVLDTGGWCLLSTANLDSSTMIIHDEVKFAIPNNHVPPSKRIVTELLAFIDKEKISSINDFGAGVGQYKHAILSERPGITWNSYDGAGNVHEYTQGFVDYVDLTLPLELPRSDWVLSLEVGEHVGSDYEAMLIRNLHHHNCKGIILSWGIVGQNGGHSHVNNHSNNYIISVFEELGYIEDLDLKKKLRNPDDNQDGSHGLSWSSGVPKTPPPWFVVSIIRVKEPHVHPTPIALVV